MQISKNTIRSYVEKYISEGRRPSNQDQSRSKSLFDIKGITDELRERLIRDPNVTNQATLEATIFQTLFNAERNASAFGRWKVSVLDITEGYNEYRAKPP